VTVFRAEAVFDLRWREWAGAGQQPGQVAVIGTMDGGVASTGRGGGDFVVCAARPGDRVGARTLQPLPFAVGVGLQRCALDGDVDAPPGQVPHDLFGEPADGTLVGVQHHPDTSFAVIVAGQPVLHEHRRIQIGDSTVETLLVQVEHHSPHRCQVLAGSAARTDRAVRMSGRDKPLRKIGERRITLYVLREGVDTATPTGRAITAIMASLAELGLELGRERRAASRESRRARHLPATKPPKLSPVRQEQLRRLAVTGEPVHQLAEAFGIGRATAYRYLSSSPT
jgi:hypothetical protein